MHICLHLMYSINQTRGLRDDSVVKVACYSFRETNSQCWRSVAPCSRVTVFEETPGEAIGGKWNHSTVEIPDFGDVSSMGWPPRTATCVKWSHLEPMKQEWQSWRSAPVPGPWIPEDCEWDPDSKHWIFLTVALWFCFVWIATVPWFFLYELGKHLAYFWFYGSLQLRDFELLKKCWCLREIMDVLETKFKDTWEFWREFGVLERLNI